MNTIKGGANDTERRVAVSDPRSRTRSRARTEQGTLPFRGGWGGARRGAGRKPAGRRAGVPHRMREARTGREPIHVTMKLRAGLPRLRVRATVALLWRCFERGKDRFGFRLVQFSIQHDHLHLIAEAPDRRALARGMQGLAVRVAKGLNRDWDRRGAVFADRYHDRVLRSPRQVRAALCYVLQNARHHGVRFVPPPGAPPGAPQPLHDPFSSAPWFDGWRPPGAPPPPPGGVVPVTRSRTWLLRVGWRRHGLVAADEMPGPAPRTSRRSA